MLYNLNVLLLVPAEPVGEWILSPGVNLEARPVCVYFTTGTCTRPSGNLFPVATAT